MGARPGRRVPIVMPEIGAEDQPVKLVQWLVEPGGDVLAGDRIAEVVAAGVLFHVPAPDDGVIVALQCSPHAAVRPGDVIATLLIRNDADYGPAG